LGPNDPNSNYSAIGKDILNNGDIPKILEMYDSLYVKKYSPVNTQFTMDFFELVI
jgi:hypothetical protein